MHFTKSFCLFAGFACLATAVVDKWTPADFDWDSMPVGSPETWKGLSQNISHPVPFATNSMAGHGQVRIAEDGSQIAAIPFALGLAWQVFNLALTGVGLAGTISGCQQNEGKADNILYCVAGLVSTVIGIGSQAAALKKFAGAQGWFAKAANTWSQSGLENIDLTVFQKRDFLDVEEERAQQVHDYIMYLTTRGLSESEPEFLGYAPDHHRLAKRSSEVHPLAPMFRLHHKKRGAMDIVSRDLGSKGIHYTVSYAGHPTHTKRNEVFQHERLNDHLMEGRFDEAASEADPAQIEFDPAAAFDQIERVVECQVGTEWKEGNVLSVQMYDNANRATFAFASIGMFNDGGVDGDLQKFQATGQPLTGCMDKN